MMGKYIIIIAHIGENPYFAMSMQFSYPYNKVFCSTVSLAPSALLAPDFYTCYLADGQVISHVCMYVCLPSSSDKTHPILNSLIWLNQKHMRSPTITKHHNYIAPPHSPPTHTRVHKESLQHLYMQLSLSRNTGVSVHFLGANSQCN